MKRTKGFVMNRLERYSYTNGDEDNILTFVKVMCADGVVNGYATGDSAMKLVKQFTKGDMIEFDSKLVEEIILGRNVTLRILDF